MNDNGTGALVAAALADAPQIRGAMRTARGRCAFTVIVDAAAAAGQTAQRWADLSDQECREIVVANDVHRWDFLTIARKFEARPRHTNPR